MRSNKDDDDYEVEARVYITPGGSFFALQEWSVPSPDDRFDFNVDSHFEALSRAEMDRLIASEKLEILNQEVLTLPPGAAAEDVPSETVYVRVPPVLKARIEGRAWEANMLTNA